MSQYVNTHFFLQDLVETLKLCLLIHQSFPQILNETPGASLVKATAAGGYIGGWIVAGLKTGAGNRQGIKVMALIVNMNHERLH